MLILNKPKEPLIGIVGSKGAVGANMRKIFPNAKCYDKDDKSGSLNKLKNCEVVFICVPTPPKKDGTCDTSIVEKVCKDLDKEMEKVNNDDAIFVIRSTVPPGTSRKIDNELVRGVVFQPEYLGETQNHPMDFDFIILGGSNEDTKKVADAYKTAFNATTRYYFTDGPTAELCKYMENCSIATTVIFCNQFYDLAKKLNIDFNKLRELYLADPRMARWFTDVYPNKRGFDGKCLPKDTEAITQFAKKIGAPLKVMERIIEVNKEYHA